MEKGKIKFKISDKKLDKKIQKKNQVKSTKQDIIIQKKSLKWTLSFIIMPPNIIFIIYVNFYYLYSTFTYISRANLHNSYEKWWVNILTQVY